MPLPKKLVFAASLRVPVETMETRVTLVVRGDTSAGEVIAVVGSCEALGNWDHQKAITLHPLGDDGDTWTSTFSVPSGAVLAYRYFKGFFLESKVSRANFLYSRINIRFFYIYFNCNFSIMVIEVFKNVDEECLTFCSSIAEVKTFVV